MRKNVGLNHQEFKIINFGESRPDVVKIVKRSGRVVSFPSCENQSSYKLPTWRIIQALMMFKQLKDFSRWFPAADD